MTPAQIAQQVAQELADAPIPDKRDDVLALVRCACQRAAQLAYDQQAERLDFKHLQALVAERDALRTAGDELAEACEVHLRVCHTDGCDPKRTGIILPPANRDRTEIKGAILHANEALANWRKVKEAP